MASPEISSQVLFPAQFADVNLVHEMLAGAIAETPHYGPEFKAYEQRRMSRDFIRTLIAHDPAYVQLVRTSTGENAGVMMSGPEYGSVFLYWSYLFPRYRTGTLAMRAMRDYVAYWENGRFHKISALVKPANRSPRLLMKRNGYHEIALLERHLFGEDYILCERKLNKIEEGYDQGLVTSMQKRLALKLRSLF